jgi:hypothetical protein
MQYSVAKRSVSRRRPTSASRWTLCVYYFSTITLFDGATGLCRMGQEDQGHQHQAPYQAQHPRVRPRRHPHCRALVGSASLHAIRRGFLPLPPPHAGLTPAKRVSLYAFCLLLYHTGARPGCILHNKTKDGNNIQYLKWKASLLSLSCSPRRSPAANRTSSLSSPAGTKVSAFACRSSSRTTGRRTCATTIANCTRPP